MKENRPKQRVITGVLSSKDGENVNQKVYGMSKIGVLLGFANGFLNLRFRGWRSHWTVQAKLFGKGSLPIVASCITYGYLSQKVAQYRGKDGPMNHFLGALSTAPFLAMLYRTNRYRAIGPAVALGVVMAMAKLDTDKSADGGEIYMTRRVLQVHPVYNDPPKAE